MHFFPPLPQDRLGELSYFFEVKNDFPFKNCTTFVRFSIKFFLKRFLFCFVFKEHLVSFNRQMLGHSLSQLYTRMNYEVISSNLQLC